METITAEQLTAAVPRCRQPVVWAPILTTAMQRYGLANDHGNVIEFLSQCAHESQDFNRLEENLNYNAGRLMQVWPKRFPTLEAAQPYANNPYKLACRIYANRMGNGDEASGDGWTFRGGGLIMVTGRDNYTRIGRLTKDPQLLLHPEKLHIKQCAADAAAAWWMDNPKLRALAVDETDDDDAADFVTITRIVNGGTTGIADREKYRAAFNRVLSTVQPSQA